MSDAVTQEEPAADGTIHNRYPAGKQRSSSIETARGFLRVAPSVPAATMAAAYVACDMS